MVVQGAVSTGHDIEYSEAELTPHGWRFCGTPRYTNVVAWLESDRSLSRDELSKVPKDEIRF
jgi:hypothetical protein